MACNFISSGTLKVLERMPQAAASALVHRTLGFASSYLLLQIMPLPRAELMGKEDCTGVHL